MVPVFIVTVGGQTPVSSHLSPIYTSKGTYKHSYKRPAPVTDTFLEVSAYNLRASTGYENAY